MVYWFVRHLCYVPLTDYLAQVRPLGKKKMGTDGMGRLLFSQGAAEHAYGGDTLKEVAGKGGSKRVAPKNFKMQFKRRE